MSNNLNLPPEIGQLTSLKAIFKIEIFKKSHQITTKSIRNIQEILITLQYSAKSHAQLLTKILTYFEKKNNRSYKHAQDIKIPHKMQEAY